MRFDNYIRGFKKNWALLLQIATLISITIGGIITPSETLEPVISTSQVKSFGIFVIAVLAGIFFYFATNRKNKKNTPKWIVVSVFCLAFTIASFFYFQYLKTSRTCLYDKNPVIIGSVYTSRGEGYVSKNEGISCETLLMDFTGKAEDIWTVDSINSSRFLLMGIYLLLLSLLSICIMSVVQIINCLTKR